jgi:hypothetical protein
VLTLGVLRCRECVLRRLAAWVRDWCLVLVVDERFLGMIFFFSLLTVLRSLVEWVMFNEGYEGR